MAKRKKTHHRKHSHKRGISGFKMGGINLGNIASEAGGAIVAEMAISKIPFPTGTVFGKVSFDSLSGVKAVAAGVALTALFPKNAIAQRAAIVARGVGYASILRGVGVVSGLLDDPLQGLPNDPLNELSGFYSPGNEEDGSPLLGTDDEGSYTPN